MQETVHMQSPAGEIKEVAADPETLIPMMNLGWKQAKAPVSQSPAAVPPATPEASKTEESHG